MPARAGHGVNHFLHNHSARSVNARLAVCIRQLADVRLFAQSQINFRQYFGTDGCHLIEERQARRARCLRQAVFDLTMLASSGDRAVPALSDFSFVIHETQFCIVIVVLAQSVDRAVPASLDCMISV